MIVCSCNVITDQEIADAIAALRTADPFVVITPGLVFRHLSKRPQCGNCLPLVTRIMLAAGSEVDDSHGDPRPAPSLKATRRR